MTMTELRPGARLGARPGQLRPSAGKSVKLSATPMSRQRNGLRPSLLVGNPATWTPTCSGAWKTMWPLQPRPGPPRPPGTAHRKLRPRRAPPRQGVSSRRRPTARAASSRARMRAVVVSSRARSHSAHIAAIAPRSNARSAPPQSRHAT